MYIVHADDITSSKLEMIIQFKKAPHKDRATTMTCTREHGSVTGMATTDFLVRHDLTHFAVETTLEISDAFFDLLAGGWDIESFEERAPISRKIRQMPPNALQVELLVGAFDIQRYLGSNDPKAMLAHLSNEPRFILPISEPEVKTIFQTLEPLLTKWDLIPAGDTLTLSFPLSSNREAPRDRID